MNAVLAALPHSPATRHRKSAPTFASLPLSTKELLFPGKCGPGSLRFSGAASAAALLAKTDAAPKQHGADSAGKQDTLAKAPPADPSHNPSFPVSKPSDQTTSSTRQNSSTPPTQHALPEALAAATGAAAGASGGVPSAAAVGSAAAAAAAAVGSAAAVAAEGEVHAHTGMPLGLAGSRLVNHRVIVWWPLDMAAYTGTVKAYHREVSAGYCTRTYMGFFDCYWFWPGVMSVSFFDIYFFGVTE